MLNVLTPCKTQSRAAGKLYGAVMTRAREAVFFARLGVPDTLDGRFDLLTLHAWLVLSRLDKGSPLAAALIDCIFDGFEAALRELGTGDFGIARRMKPLADAFYGRLKAYDAAKDACAMEAALVRNLYRGTAAPAAAEMTAYVLAARATPSEEGFDFGPPPAMKAP